MDKYIKKDNNISIQEKCKKTEGKEFPANDTTKIQEELKHTKTIRRQVNNSVVRTVLLYMCLFILIWKMVPKFVIERISVKGVSMEDTLHDKEQLIMEKISYKFGEPKRFDIVILMPYGKDIDEHYVKRVIGLPGETIEIKEGLIYINGKLLKEDYGKEIILDGGVASEPVSLGEDEYFVMGDNRNDSCDSRDESLGPIKKELIEGKVVFRIWPLKKLGLIN